VREEEGWRETLGKKKKNKQKGAAAALVSISIVDSSY